MENVSQDRPTILSEMRIISWELILSLITLGSSIIWIILNLSQPRTITTSTYAKFQATNLVMNFFNIVWGVALLSALIVVISNIKANKGSPLIPGMNKRIWNIIAFIPALIAPHTLYIITLLLNFTGIL